MAGMLLIDSCDSAFDLILEESNIEKGLLKFRGKFQEAEAVNKNKRMYPYEVLEENIDRLMDIVKKRGLVGELDHPTDSIIHFREASHVITKLWWDGNILMGEGEILNTPHGKVLKALVNDGVRVGISSRGVGNGKVSENGVLVIEKGYKLITFDAVADPSTFDAFQEKVVATKRENTNYYKNNEKNSNSSINIVNKDLLIAAFKEIIQEKADKVKANL